MIDFIYHLSGKRFHQKFKDCYRNFVKNFLITETDGLGLIILEIIHLLVNNKKKELNFSVAFYNISQSNFVLANFTDLSEIFSAGFFLYHSKRKKKKKMWKWFFQFFFFWKLNI